MLVADGLHTCWVSTPPEDVDPFVRVVGSQVHNLRSVDVAAPRDAFVAFTGVSGSGKSSLAFGTVYAEAQRRYFESVAPYARRLLLPAGAPKVDDITGVDPFRNLHVQQIVRATMGERVGVGVFEQLALGPHDPSGFTELLDGAR